MAPARIKHTEHHDNNNHKVNVPSLRRALVNRNFAKLWYGQAVSAVGDTVFGTTLVLWVSQVLVRGSAWAPAAVSGILVAAGAAVGLVGPVAGVFVDRWNRKSTMMRTEAVRAAMVVGLTGLSFVPVRDLPVGLWLVAVYLVVFVLNASGQFFNPARFATTGDVVHGEEDRTRAAGLAEATTSAAGIIGPPIAAVNVFFVTRDLHASSGLFGIAETAMGVGFIIGALAAGRMVRWIGARALTWSGLLATGVLAAGYALQRSFPAGLIMLAIYAIPIAMLNTAVAPLLLDVAPREYLGRVMAVFMPVNQFASMLSVVISGWLISTVLRSFRASFAGITLNSVSLIFIVAGGLIFASGVRAFAALPGPNVP